MISLYDYDGKRVKIVDTDGKEWHGYVDFYTSKYDNEEGEGSITCRMDDPNNSYVEFMQHEVKSIEVEK